jgi:tRNA dimethylallyltransferase
VAQSLPKIVVIVGPTASGKTDLSLHLATKFNGEIISADSRQVYKKMTIGTAKPAGEWKMYEGKKRFLVGGIPHYGIDIVDPGKTFSMADFKTLATEAIKDIIERGKVPFVVGGTGLYVWGLVDNLTIPASAPNKKLRREFELKTLGQLVALLERIDPEAAAMVDLKNKRRVLRALEVGITTGESFVKQRQHGEPLYETLQLGIAIEKEELNRRIAFRVNAQMQAGLLKEVSALSKKYGWELSSMSGIGYKEFGFYLRGEMTLVEVMELLMRDTRRYAKRQLIWFKRDKRIQWLIGEKIEEQAANRIATFIKK